MDSTINTTSEIEFINTICHFINIEAKKNIEEKGYFTFVLSGGKTPRSIFQELILNYKNSIDWTKVHFFWLDERYVAANHQDSNYKLAYDYLLSKLNKVGSVNRIKTELEISNTIRNYTEVLTSFFNNNIIKFDFILLGMGEDGHVASLFPESKEIKLSTQKVLATNKKYNGYYRISLGLNLINNSSFKILMVNNTTKINILKSNNPIYPINLVKNKTIITLEKR